MTVELKTFKAQAESHIEALRKLIDAMPYRGDVSEESNQVGLRIALNNLDSHITGVRAFDLVDVDVNQDLMLVESAENTFNDDQDFNPEPDLGLFRVHAWLDDGDDTTTAVETYECLICAQSKEQVEAMKQEIADMLAVDSDLFINVESIETVYVPAKAEEPGRVAVVPVEAVSVEGSASAMDALEEKFSVYSMPVGGSMVLDCRDYSGDPEALTEIADILNVPVETIDGKLVTIYQ